MLSIVTEYSDYFLETEINHAFDNKVRICTTIDAKYYKYNTWQIKLKKSKGLQIKSAFLFFVVAILTYFYHVSKYRRFLHILKFSVFLPSKSVGMKL